MSWQPPDDVEREKTPMGRLEILCEKYLAGNTKDREIILSFLDEAQRHLFLHCCGWRHLFSEQKLYDITRT